MNPKQSTYRPTHPVLPSRLSHQHFRGSLPKIPRSGPASSKKRSSSKRGAPSPTPPSTSERGGTTTASTTHDPVAAGAAAASPAGAAAPTAPAPAPSPHAAAPATPSESVATGGTGTNERASGNGTAPETASGSGRTGGDSATADATAGGRTTHGAEGNNSDGATGPDEIGGGGSEAFGEWDEGDGVSSDDGSLVVEGLDDGGQGEEKKGPAQRTSMEGREGRRGAGLMDPPLSGGKRSHGRSMQGEAAAHVSTARGPPNLRWEGERERYGDG